MFQKAGRPRFKTFWRGLNSIEGTNNQEIMYKLSTLLRTVDKPEGNG